MALHKPIKPELSSLYSCGADVRYVFISRFGGVDIAACIYVFIIINIINNDKMKGVAVYCQISFPPIHPERAGHEGFMAKPQRPGSGRGSLSELKSSSY